MTATSSAPSPSLPHPSGGEVTFVDCAPALVGAIRGQDASFLHVALAYHFGHVEAGDECSPEDRETCREHFPDILANFERRNGRIRRSYFGAHVFAAAALTQKDRVELWLGSAGAGIDDPACVQLLLRAQSLGYSAWHRLARYDRRQCQNMIFSVISEVLRRSDGPRATPEGNGRAVTRPAAVLGADELAMLERQLDEAEDFLLRCATRRTQIHYLRGVLIGMLALVLLLGVTWTAATAIDHVGRIGGRLLLVALAGGAGAVVSVIMRMTSSSLQINLPTLSQSAKEANVVFVGALRPLVGAAIGIAIFVIAAGGLMHIDVGTSTDPTSTTMVFVSLAFLSGFSERLAQDVFVRSGQGVLGAFGDTPTNGPSAGLAPPPGGQAREPFTAARKRREASAGRAVGGRR